MADRWMLGEAAALDDYIPTPPSNILGNAAHGVKDWWTNQPSWLDRAKAENLKTTEAFQRGGMGEIAKQLATNTTEAQDLYGAFGVGNVKGVGGKSLAPGALAAVDEYRPPFYSAVEQAVQGAKQNAAPGQQWAGFLRNQPGVKPEEVEALGLGKLFEQPGAVPKQAVLGEIAANRVNVGEVYKGGERPTTFSVSSAGDLSGAPALRMDFATAAEANAELASRQASHPGGYHSMAELPTVGSRPKFEQYTLPGGENYREMLLTLPTKKITPSPQEIENLAKMRYEGYHRKENDPPWERIAPDVQRLYREQAGEKIIAAENPAAFRSSHYDEPNILAHVRYNDRVIDGKKTLFVEEVQSDWHQAGKRKGYLPQQEAELARLVKERDDLIAKSPENVEAINVLHDKIREIGIADMGVPDAPFKTTWPELAMKRIIREAAEKGYDKVAWTPGSVQAARYDLSKQVDKISSYRLQKGGELELKDGQPQYRVEAFKDGKLAIDKYVAENELADLVGKELADKIIKQESGARSYSGLDLKVGGEGMKGFYDEILPATVNKLVKKHGGRVTQTDMTGASEVGLYGGGGNLLHRFNNINDAKEWDRLHPLVGPGKREIKPLDNRQSVHTIEITPALRAAAMKGFPLFTAGGVAATGVMGDLAAQDEYR